MKLVNNYFIYQTENDTWFHDGHESPLNAENFRRKSDGKILSQVRREEKQQAYAARGWFRNTFWDTYISTSTDKIRDDISNGLKAILDEMALAKFKNAVPVRNM